MPKPSGQTVFLGAVLVGSGVLVSYLVLTHGDAGTHRDTAEAIELPRVGDVHLVAAPRQPPLRLDDIPFHGERAYGYLKQICRIGPRPSGSTGMTKQQKLLKDHFARLGGTVSMQSFRLRHPLRDELVPAQNMIVQWHPERKLRILLCAHYDTRPFPDLDKKNPRGTFVGANDGGSGTALLMEMAHEMPKLEGKYGVDFVLFDAEEFIFVAGRGLLSRQHGTYLVGSQHFADQYVKDPPDHRYAAGILFDMVGDANLELYFEKNQMKFEKTRKLALDIWGVAERLRVPNFVRRVRHELTDDHLPLNRTAKIPTVDLIDFDYPDLRRGNVYWHTEADTVDKCSPLSLAKVGWVVHEWLKAIHR